jgi:ankyrin repeat protein
MSGPNTSPRVEERHDLGVDPDTVLRPLGKRYDNNTAQGNSRNIYGDVYNTYHAGSQRVPSEPESTPYAPGPIVESVSKSLAFEHMDDRFATIVTAHSDTCQWLFQRHEYNAWRNPDAPNTDCGFLWLKGKPGAGKSTLMKKAQQHGEQEHGDLIISFFFNARGVELQKSTQGMYRSLLCQLLNKRMEQLAALSERLGYSHHFQLLQSLLAKVPHKMTLPTPQDWPIELLKDLLRDLVLAFSPDQVARCANAFNVHDDVKARETYRHCVLALAQTHLTFYVDALDECEHDDAREMVDFLGNLRATATQADVGFRVLLASRHYPHITFNACRELILDSQGGHKTDIAEYTRSKLRIGESSLACEIQASIQARASGVFLWVVLVIRIMNKLFDRGQIRQLKQKLDKIPDGLHELFEEILQGDTQDGEERLLVFQWLLFSQRPLSSEEFYHAVTGTSEFVGEVDDCEQNIVSEDDMRRFLLDASKGLAEMTKSADPTVQFIHESVKDYLLGAGLVALAPSHGADVVKHCHARLQLCCRYYLEHTQISLSPLLANSPMWHDAEQTYPFLEYAVAFMVYHAECAYSPESPLGDFVAAFPHDLWRKFNNFITKRCRLTAEVSPLYFLILEGALKLSEAHIKAKEMPRRWSKHVLPEYHRSFLGVAVNNGDEGMVEMLLGHGIGANWPAKRGHTCLSLAVEKRDDRMVEILIDAGATAEPQANHTWGSDRLGPVLRSASEEIILKILVSDVYPTRWHEDFNWILFSAEKNGFFKVERILVSRLEGLAREVQDPGQASPVERYPEPAFLAACMRGLPDIIPPLARHGINLNVTFCGNTGLSIATQRCLPKVVKALLSVGADPNIPDGAGDFPIHTAVVSGRHEILRMLLDPGAYPSASDEGPPHTAATHGNETAIVPHVDNVANINAHNADQEHPLYLAALHSRPTFARLLLDRGADDLGNSALFAASYYGNSEILDMLLEAGDPVSIEQLDKAAFKALENGHDSVVERLVQKGAKRPSFPPRIEGTDGSSSASERPIQFTPEAKRPSFPPRSEGSDESSSASETSNLWFDCLQI